MHRSSRRTVAAFLIVAATSSVACAAERAAPVLTPPPPPPPPTTAVPTTSPAPPTAPPTTTAPASTTTASTTTTTAPAVAPGAWKAFDEALASKLLGSGDFALSVAVAVDGTLVHHGAFGYRVPPPLPPELIGGTNEDQSADAPSTTVRRRPEDVEPADRFRIASISKVLTATVVLQLVEEGTLQLDQPVGRLLGEHVGVAVADPGVAAVTVRQLLSHTSGLPGYQNLFFGGGADSCASAARVGLAGGLAVPPAIHYMYSNFGYCLLGLLIEKATGRPYESAVRERLLEPLGITGMRMAGTVDPYPNEVQHPSVPTRNYMEVLGAAGAWVATPADVVKIVDSLDPAKPGWHPLSRRTLGLMRRPARGVDYPRHDHWYGLGLIVSADGSWGHTGTVENSHAMVLARPDGVTWSVLVSGQYPWDSEDLRRIFDDAVATAGIRFD